jgi:hypothetical protein
MNPSAPPISDLNHPREVIEAPMPIPIPIYEEQMHYRHSMVEFQREFFEKQLRENLPKNFLITYAIIMILIGLAEIALQILCFIIGTALSFLANGIWGAFALFAISGSSFSLGLSILKYGHNKKLWF